MALISPQKNDLKFMKYSIANEYNVNDSSLKLLMLETIRIVLI